MYRLAVLVSGGGTNLQAIMDRVADGRLPGVEIAVVIASKENTKALERAGHASIPNHVIAKTDYLDTGTWDLALVDVLQNYQPDLIVLAGYLCLLGPEIIKVWHNKIINVHPSLIPAFCGPGLYGLKVHEAVLDYGAKITGATVHLVDEKYDNGPIVLQKAIEVQESDTPESLQRRVMEEAEQIILPQAVQYFAKGLVTISSGKTRIIREEKE